MVIIDDSKTLGLGFRSQQKESIYFCLHKRKRRSNEGLYIFHNFLKTDESFSIEKITALLKLNLHN